MAKLSSYVHVADADGTYHAFGPSDDLPAWAVEAITNPKVWAEAPVPEEKPKPKRTTKGA